MKSKKYVITMMDGEIIRLNSEVRPELNDKWIRYEYDNGPTIYINTRNIKHITEE